MSSDVLCAYCDREPVEKMKIAFYDTHSYDKEAFQRANQLFNEEIDYFDFRLDEKSVLSCVGYKAVCVFVNDVLNTKVLDVLAENGVELIVLRCAGYNNVDIEYATLIGITVVRVPSYSPFAIAEHGVALLMALTRKIPQAYIKTKSGNFTIDGLVGRSLHGLNAGIIGTGKIGKCMAEILGGMGMNVMLYDVIQDHKWADRNNFNYFDLKSIFVESDVISLHCPLTKETKHIVNKGSLSLMKKDAVIINTSRGALIETGALVEVLKAKRIGGAALDVYEEESDYFYSDWSDEVISDDILIRLLTFPNVIVTSHQAFLTKDALDEIAKVSLDNIKKYEEQNTLENVIWE